MQYDVIIIGAGPGGIFSAYQLMKKRPELKVGVFESGTELEKRRCPIDGEKIRTCIGCKTCSIMSGFGGAGAFSDGKYNITNDFGGTLYEHIGKKKALELMRYVDQINLDHGGAGTRLYSTAGTEFKKICIQNKLRLLDASVRHLGTDINYIVLGNLYAEMKGHIDFHFSTPVDSIELLQRKGSAILMGRKPLREGNAAADPMKADPMKSFQMKEAPMVTATGFISGTGSRKEVQTPVTASSQPAAAAANGWRRSAVTCRSRPSPTVWI